MKRVWFALGLLSMLILCSIVVSAAIRRHAANAIKITIMAEDAGRKEQLAAAFNLSESGVRYWEKQEKIFAFFLRHDVTESVSTAFSKLSAYAETGDKDEFLALCKELMLQLEHIRDMELPTLKNIF